MSRVPWCSPLEIAWGIPIGKHSVVKPLEPSTDLEPRAALERSLLPLLATGRCVVVFSGGRDSSLILAVAASVARREGLPLPVPVTMRFPHSDDADEDVWQDYVVDHLDLRDHWVVHRMTDEMDIVGPYARRAQASVGICAPFNNYFYLPAIDAAGGGAVVSGSGGDELFDVLDRPVATRALYGRRNVGDLWGLAVGLAPRPLRRLRAQRDSRLEYSWLTKQGQQTLTREVARWTTGTFLRYDRTLLEWLWPSRMVQVANDYKMALAASHDAVYRAPLYDPVFLSCFAGKYGKSGPRSRRVAFTDMAGDLLPAPVLARVSKASLDGAFLTATARAVAASWDGGGVDTAIVDVDALRAEWSSMAPDPHSYLLLQSILGE